MNSLIKIPASTIAKLKKGVAGHYDEVAEGTPFTARYVGHILDRKRRITDKNIIVIHEAKKVMERLEREKRKANERGKKIAQEIENTLA